MCMYTMYVYIFCMYISNIIINYMFVCIYSYYFIIFFIIMDNAWNALIFNYVYGHKKMILIT